MDAEIQLLSPLVPVRQVRFLRFCKQHAEGLWGVVDVSVEIGRDPTNPHPFISCRRLPSGCVLQDMPNGYSKVIFFIEIFFLCMLSLWILQRYILLFHMSWSCLLSIYWLLLLLEMSESRLYMVCS